MLRRGKSAAVPARGETGAIAMPGTRSDRAGVGELGVRLSMVRRILNLLCLVSPLVFVGLLVLWVRSYFWIETFALRHDARDGSGRVVTHAAMLINRIGCVGVRAGRWRTSDSPQPRSDFPDGLRGRHEATPLSAVTIPLSGSFWNRIGFSFNVDTNSAPGDTEHAFTLIVPHWLPLWLSAAPPGGWGGRRRGGRLRVEAGLFKRCG
jgi:hypothetical protein